ncbi:TPA: translation initiation factor IF-2 [Candidatus Uhrbacteria bacterium]|nr:MAG: translation initiation factor IF-2 [Candidatus Uhrbacteria bacterium RIFCSPHIGHO2_02_FULL_54_11]HBL39395.1 translation initiation factor IF-2 [Candidatus Uhrbacteria bacterium]
MNLTELARRLRTNPEELRLKLPELGFSVGKKAIKIDNRVASQIQEAWREMKRRERLEEKMAWQKAQGEKKDIVKDKKVILPSVLSVREFAERLGLPIARVMQEMMRSGILASLNERIDFDTAAILAGDLGYECAREEAAKGEEAQEKDLERLEEVLALDKGAAPRPPVVVVMGHVDHGKTKLLDAIRKTNVMDTETGGITQHIGAYTVAHQGKPITFIDTPGHEAFTVMRSRGAKVADIAILVIAADDGVQPQTREAIDIIQAAKMPFVVALNKMDMPGANKDRVLGELAERNLIPEEWGGKMIVIPISAKQGTGIDKLLEMLTLVSDMEKDHIVADPKRPAIGTVIDSKIDKGQGPVATVLVQSGTLRVGDVLGVRGVLYGKVRAMLDWTGAEVESAEPSVPVKVLGWKANPSVGDVMEVPEDAKHLKKQKFQSVRSGLNKEMTATKASGSDEESGKKLLPILVKADVLGSLEALLGLLDRIVHEDVGVSVVGRGLGNVTESDIAVAQSTGAVIYAFGVKPTTTAEALSRDANVEIKREGVIYKIVDDVLVRLQKLLPDAYIVRELGEMEVLANFRKLDGGWIIGGRVKKDQIKTLSKFRIFREDKIIGEGKVDKIQIGMREVKKAQPGEECGVQYKGNVKAEVGDRLEFYEEEYQGRKLQIEGMDAR